MIIHNKMLTFLVLAAILGIIVFLLMKKSCKHIETKDASPVHAEQDYIPASNFSGSKPGYVFKTGDMGLGYYLDKFRGTPPDDTNEDEDVGLDAMFT